MAAYIYEVFNLRRDAKKERKTISEQRKTKQGLQNGA